MKKCAVLFTLVAGCATRVAAGDADLVVPDAPPYDTTGAPDTPIAPDAIDEMHVDSAQSDSGIDTGRDDTGDERDVVCPPSSPVRCDGVCVGDTDENPSRCGVTCTLCPAPESGTATCVAGNCAVVCAAGHLLQGGECVDFPPPRLIRPITNSRVSVRNPTLRWEPAAGASATHIRICADRACSQVHVEFDADGATAQVQEELPAGVWYWTAQSISDGVRSEARSATWEMHTPAQSAAVETSLANLPDVNGDGLDDFAIGGSTPTSGDGTMVFIGNRAGEPNDVRILPVETSGQSSQPFSPLHAGDINGDGFTDIIQRNNFAPDTAVSVFTGLDTGVEDVPVQTLGGPTGSEKVYPPSFENAGDFNGDGYSDALTSLGDSTGTQWSYVWMKGGPDGYALQASIGSIDYDLSSVTAGDWDADGYDDVLGVGLVDRVLRWWPGSPAGPSTSMVVSQFSGQSSLAIHGIGDLDGDGLLDAIVDSEDGITPGRNITLIRGGPSGPTVGATSACGSTDDLLIGATPDINADGKRDLALLNRLSLVIKFCVSTESGFQPDTEHSVQTSCLSARGACRDIGDWNGDGLEDFAVTCPGQVILFLGRMDGQLQPVQISPSSIRSTASSYGGTIS